VWSAMLAFVTYTEVLALSAMLAFVTKNKGVGVVSCYLCNVTRGLLAL
jgi:hypothetical protein